MVLRPLRLRAWPATRFTPAPSNTRHSGHELRALSLAVGCALAGLAGGAALLPATALAQDQREAARHYAIPASGLGDALARFAATAGVPLSFDPRLLAGRQSPGLQGRHTVREGFARLLDGSGYEAVELAGRGYSLRPAAPVPAAAAPAPTRTPPASPAPPPAPAPEAAVELSTVTVSAPLYGARETRTLDGSTASVGIITGRDIEDGQIRYFQDSLRRLGNVMDAAFLNSGFVIRGMSTEGFVPAGAPMGSVYIDGVLQARYSSRFGARHLWDAEQVEVYRGPQSTLSGRAATAGAVYIKSKDPSFEREAELSGTVGNQHHVGGAFMLNTPLGSEERFAVRLSGSSERSRSEVSYPGYEQYAGHDDFRTEISRNLRAKLLFQSSPQTRAVLSHAVADDRPNERLIGEGPGFGLDDQRGDWYAFPTYAEFRRTKVRNTGLEVTHDFSDALRLTSLTGLHNGVTRRRSVDYGTPGLIDGIDGKVDDTLTTQELRLNYSGERWDWVAGVFASHQDFKSRFGAIAVPYLQLGETFRRKTTNAALFGEATYEFVPRWRATVGGRWDYLREQSDQQNSDSYPYGAPPNTYANQADFSETNFVPKLGLSHEIAPGHQAGFTYSEGFRTGGFYVNYNTGQAAYYGPETAKNHELFYKGRFLDNRLTLNANLFFTTYKDQQIEIRPDPNNQAYRETSNAASSRAWGFEIEPSFQVNPRFSVFASIGYLDTKFKEFNHAAYGDLSGQPFPEAPRWSLGLGGRYRFTNGFFVGGDATYTADYVGRFGIAPQDPIDSRFLVNAQAGYRQGNWELTVFAENLFDERYVTFIDRDALPVYAQMGPRRGVGVNLKVRF